MSWLSLPPLKKNIGLPTKALIEISIGIIELNFSYQSTNIDFLSSVHLLNVLDELWKHLAPPPVQLEKTTHSLSSSLIYSTKLMAGEN